MGVAENTAVVKRLFDEVWNGRRYDVIDDPSQARDSGEGDRDRE